MNLTHHVVDTLTESQRALDALVRDSTAHEAIAEASRLMISALDRGGRILSCGNGGSMCDAMHFAEELTGRYRRDRRPLSALALSDPAHLSCVANDYGYDQVFGRLVSALARPGDCLLCISTSGDSPNVLGAAEAAREAGARVVALTGRSGSGITSRADVEIITPGGRYADRVQELHIKVIHILVELIERRFFPELYAAGD